MKRQREEVLTRRNEKDVFEREKQGWSPLHTPLFTDGIVNMSKGEKRVKREFIRKQTW